MSKALLVLALSAGIFAGPCASTDAVRPRDSVKYLVFGSQKGNPQAVSAVWIIAETSETVNGKPYRWWRLVIQKGDGAILAIRALSERVPMTSGEGVGRVLRYIYSPAPDKAFEYVDRSTGYALLPELGFEDGLLPTPAVDARYSNGFANSGSLLGYALRRAALPGDIPQTTLSRPHKLQIRTDFIIGTSRTFKDNGVPPATPDENWTFVDWDESDIEAMLEAGFNYFGTTPVLRPLLEDKPAFFTGALVFPDDLYRSNYLTQRMFIDEPGIRLGYSGYAASPDVVAEALRRKTAEEQPLSSRFLVRTGDLDIYRPPAPSWETEYSTAWHQLQAGAAGIVHEGRYVHRGYGWDPEHLFGQALDGLTDRDQFNFIFAFLRGAARPFNASWGTSLYGHTDPKLRLPAFIRAYEMGAKYLWFWTSDHQHHMPFTEQLRLARAICDYADEHPRPDHSTTLRQAEVGIALPPGYIFGWNGPWGMKRDQLTPAGVPYGDVIAGMAWEGILCSRTGIEFDFLVDHPGIEKLGYKRLIRVREDGTLDVTPKWKNMRTPKDLIVQAIPRTDASIAKQQDISAAYMIRRAPAMTIDGDFSEWSNAEWVTLGRNEWLGDNYEVSASVVVPEKGAQRDGNTYLGMTLEPMTEDLKEAHLIEAWPHEKFFIVTALTTGSPAYNAGVRVGDAVSRLADREMRDEYQIHLVSERYKNSPGASIPVLIRRNGLEFYGGHEDLSARFAFMLDDSNLYFAAEVMDDIHVQAKAGAEMWMHDSVQLAFDPILDRNKGGMGPNNHKIGFSLRDGKVQTWRWDGRRGQPIGELANALVQIVRREDCTLYEASIPIRELMPLAPDTYPKLGVVVVVNDNDAGSDARKARLESVPGATTRGNNPDRFAVFECEPSGNLRKVDGCLVWRTHSMPVGGSAELTLGISSPQTKGAIVRTKLASMDTPDAKPAVAETRVPVTPEPSEFGLIVSSQSPPGRYKLRVSVRTDSGWSVAEDAATVFIYPQ